MEHSDGELRGRHERREADHEQVEERRAGGGPVQERQ
jgi:hypothetical protein